MGGIACGDEIVDKYYLFIFDEVFVLFVKKILLSNLSPFFFCASRLVSRKGLFSERTHQGLLINMGEIFSEVGSMIWSSNNPVKRANRRMYYNIACGLVFLTG